MERSPRCIYVDKYEPIKIRWLILNKLTEQPEEEYLKPDCILGYNANMGAIDKTFKLNWMCSLNNEMVQKNFFI